MGQCRSGQPFHADTSSGRRRAAARKSSPVKWATGINATWVARAGMPSRSAASAAYGRWMVVHDDASPRLRSASMKLHTAGRIEP